MAVILQFPKARIKTAPMTPVGREVDQAAFEAALAESQGDELVLAYFWGTDCPNCEAFKADWPKLSGDIPSGLKLLQVNAYKEMELARRYGLFGVPAFLLFRRGKLLGKMSQYYGRDYFLTVLREASGTAPEPTG